MWHVYQTLALDNLMFFIEMPHIPVLSGFSVQNMRTVYHSGMELIGVATGEHEADEALGFGLEFAEGATGLVLQTISVILMSISAFGGLEHVEWMGPLSHTLDGLVETSHGAFGLVNILLGGEDAHGH